MVARGGISDLGRLGLTTGWPATAAAPPPSVSRRLAWVWAGRFLASAAAAARVVTSR